MAPPNLAIRSDSWLDLSRCLAADSRLAARGGSEQPAEVAGRRKTRAQLVGHYSTEAAEKRHSIGAYLDSAGLLTDACQSTGEYHKEQHLLIRVRQRSYFNSRCSSSGSLSSHLSQSIELNATSESHLSTSAHCIESNRLLKRQPLKLATLRKSLSKTSNSRHRQSPLVRSFSSLSERLTSKLSNLTSSWKQLLYEYKKDSQDTPVAQEANQLRKSSDNNNINNTRLLVRQPEEIGQALLLRSAPLSTQHRRLLTSDWVSRHQQQPASRQQATVESNRSSGGDRELSSRHPSGYPVDRSSRARSVDSCSLSSSSSISSPLQVIEATPTRKRCQKWPAPAEQVAAAADQRHRKERSDTRSSSTLVSRSSSSATTLNYSQPPTYNSNSNNNNKNNNSPQQHSPERTSTQKTTMTQPTSDYWSSSTTNTDYGAQRGRRAHQQLVQQMRQAPALGPDTEYYFQVADAERQRCVAAGLLDEEEDCDAADFEDYAEPADESCLLDRSQVELVQMIGEGQKGYVFLGKLQSRDGRIIQDVAIKTLKYETEYLIEKLMREAHLMRQLEHPHIIRFIGVCPDTPALIAMELAELGEIKQYLKLNEHIIPASHLVLFTFQISTALSYLESRQCVHRDVAARNVLVCSHNCVKLADFDLSRDLQPPTGSELTTAPSLQADGQPSLMMSSSASPTFGHYVATAQGKLPIRWLAPESLTMRRFTSASDVWMFAVCAWEFFHYGSMRPWHSIRNNQVLTAIKSGQRLARPPTCPERLYQLMLRCWSYSPDDRPRFKDIKLNLWSIYLKERARVQLDMEQRQHMLLQSRIISPPPPPQGSNECFIQEQTDFRQQPTVSPHHHHHHHHHLRYSYSSNASGYSSTANNPMEHSNNSSRSSTMGSLMRQKPIQTAAAGRGQSQPDTRFRRIPGHMLQRQRSHGSIITDSRAESQQERFVGQTRDDQMLSQVQRQHQPRPISEMYTDARRVQEERLVASQEQATQGAKLRARVRSSNMSSSRPSSTCYPSVIEPLPRSETTYDGLTHAEDTRLRGSSTRRHQAEHKSIVVSLPHHQQQANSSTYPQNQSARTNIDQFRQPNASLTPNSLEEQHQLAVHQRLLGHIKQSKPDYQHQHHRRSINMTPQTEYATSGSATTETVDQSLEILESLIAGRNFSKRSAVVKNLSNSIQPDRDLMENRTSRF